MSDNYGQMEEEGQETLLKRNEFYGNLQKESEKYDWLDLERALRHGDKMVYNFHLTQALVYFKDELIAQLKGGTHEITLDNVFFSAYDYFEHIKNDNPILYFSLWKNYSEKIVKYIEEARGLVKNGVSLDILAITPIEKWGRLLKNFQKKSEKIEENFVFENIENLENGKFFAKKIFENSETWEGIFDENKKFLEGKKIIGDEIQEGKFHNGKIVFGKTQIGENWQYGKFLTNGIMLQDGIVCNNVICGVIKNSKPTGEYGNLRDWDEEKMKCEGAMKMPTKWNDIVMEKKGKFELRGSELILSDGIIEIIKIQNFKPIEGPIKFNTFPARQKMTNFFRENKIILKIIDNQLVLNEEDWEKMENFMQKNYFYDLRKILMDFGLGALYEQRKAKQKVEKILQK